MLRARACVRGRMAIGIAVCLASTSVPSSLSARRLAYKELETRNLMWGSQALAPGELSASPQVRGLPGAPFIAAVLGETGSTLSPTSVPRSPADLITLFESGNVKPNDAVIAFLGNGFLNRGVNIHPDSWRQALAALTTLLENQDDPRSVRCHQ